MQGLLWVNRLEAKLQLQSEPWPSWESLQAGF